MTTYIIWDKENDDSFRPAYLALSGEKIQDRPQENAAQTHYMVGSSRVTPEQAATMAGWEGVTVHDGVPQDWVSAE